jgi:hypothetical protein
MKLDIRRVEIIEDQVAAVLRSKTPAERLRIGFNIWMSARRMLLSHIKHSHPDWSQLQVENEVARRFLHGSVEDIYSAVGTKTEPIGNLGSTSEKTR